MSERGPAFDAAVVVYEASLKRVLDLAEEPDDEMPISEYRAALKRALQAQQRAHKAVMAAWA